MCSSSPPVVAGTNDSKLKLSASGMSDVKNLKAGWARRVAKCRALTASSGSSNCDLLAPASISRTSWPPTPAIAIVAFRNATTNQKITRSIIFVSDEYITSAVEKLKGPTRHRSPQLHPNIRMFVFQPTPHSFTRNISPFSPPQKTCYALFFPPSRFMKIARLSVYFFNSQLHRDKPYHPPSPGKQICRRT
jgi:hypothetical protein